MKNIFACFLTLGCASHNTTVTTIKHRTPDKTIKRSVCFKTEVNNQKYYDLKAKLTRIKHAFVNVQAWPNNETKNIRLSQLENQYETTFDAYHQNLKSMQHNSDNSLNHPDNKRTLKQTIKL
jgi:hypothetical protein